MIWVNFKIYQNTFGEGALRLAQICKKVAEREGVRVVPLVSPLDLREIKKKVGGEVWLQHVDLFLKGRYTGWVSPLAAIEAGADGSLLNHSEHRLPPGKIRQILSRVKKEKGDFEFMVAIKSKGQIRWLKRLRPKPDFVAYEPPELIGSEISVSQAKPEVVRRIVDLLPDYQIIVGAGIKSGGDVKKALELGAKGILVSSGVVQAKDPEKELVSLAQAFK